MYVSRARKLWPANVTNIRVSNLSAGLSGFILPVLLSSLPFRIYYAVAATKMIPPEKEKVSGWRALSRG